MREKNKEYLRELKRKWSYKNKEETKTNSKIMERKK
jgi:hypothetical protein